MMRQDRFTEQAQEVLQASQELVREARHSEWDVEHVFYALVARKDGLAREVLTRMGIDADALGRAIKERLDRSPKLSHDVVQIYTTPRIVQMLESANAEAARLKDEFVGVEHLLVAISDATDGEAAAIMASSRSRRSDCTARSSRSAAPRASTARRQTSATSRSRSTRVT